MKSKKSSSLILWALVLSLSSPAGATGTPDWMQSALDGNISNAAFTTSLTLAELKGIAFWPSPETFNQDLAEIRQDQKINVTFRVPKVPGCELKVVDAHDSRTGNAGFTVLTRSQPSTVSCLEQLAGAKAEMTRLGLNCDNTGPQQLCELVSQDINLNREPFKTQGAEVLMLSREKNSPPGREKYLAESLGISYQSPEYAERLRIRANLKAMLDNAASCVQEQNDAVASAQLSEATALLAGLDASDPLSQQYKDTRDSLDILVTQLAEVQKQKEASEASDELEELMAQISALENGADADQLLQKISRFFNDHRGFSDEQKNQIYAALFNNWERVAQIEDFSTFMNALNQRPEARRAISDPELNSMRERTFSRWKDQAREQSEFQELISALGDWESIPSSIARGRRSEGVDNTERASQMALEVFDTWLSQSVNEGDIRSKRVAFRELSQWGRIRTHKEYATEVNDLAARGFNAWANAADSKEELAQIEKELVSWKSGRLFDNSQLVHAHSTIAKKYANSSTKETFDPALAKKNLEAAIALRPSKESLQVLQTDMKNLKVGTFEFQMNQIRQSGMRPSYAMYNSFAQLNQELQRDIAIACYSAVGPGTNIDPMAAQAACTDAQNRFNIVKEAAYPGSTQRSISSVAGNQPGMSQGIPQGPSQNFPSPSFPQQSPTLCTGMQTPGCFPTSSSGVTPLFVNGADYQMFR